MLPFAPVIATRSAAVLSIIFPSLAIRHSRATAAALDFTQHAVSYDDQVRGSRGSCAYAGDGIRVNAIAPGWIATQLTQALRDDPERNDQIAGRTAMKRWGDTAEVAGGALFLSSPLASFVTGAVLVIDGGYSIT